MQRYIDRIAFVGLGLIGTSLMQSLRLAAEETGRRIELVGFDPGFDREDIDCITGCCGLDRFETEPEKLYDADVIVLCAPVVANIALLDEVARHARKGAVVTDMSSTKSAISEKAKELGLEFVGMHPIAGREQQGYRAASPDLLSGRLMIVCTDSRPPLDGRSAEFVELIEAAGCTPLMMTPEEHDRIYANISHLPQLVSTALMTHCRENIARSGPGFASATRLAGSAWPVWKDIVSTNSRNIADELDTFARLVARIASEVRSLDLDALESRFDEANQLYQSLKEGARP